MKGDFKVTRDDQAVCHEGQMQTRRSLLGGVAATFAPARMTVAHHSTAMYDTQHPVTVTVVRVVLAFCLLYFAGLVPLADAQGRGARPAPRIVTFEVRPSTVKAGEPVLLVWQTENPAGVTIDPDIGAVTPRGSKQITPTATTTYTLTMRNGPMRAVTVTVQGAPTAANARSRAAGVNAISGVPDLTGVYNFAGLPQGTMPPPLTPGAEKYRIERTADDVKGRTTLTTGNDCKPLGIPQSYITPYPFQIVQTPKLLVMIFEYPNAIRWIPLDARPHELDPDPSWMGNAVGTWDGDTLVVDTIGFNDKTEVHGFMHTDALHVVERFKKLANGSLQYDVTVEDPNVWQTAWVIPTRTFARRAELENVSEFVCESTVDYSKLFKKAP